MSRFGAWARTLFPKGRCAVAFVLAAVLNACTGGPPTPAWQAEAKPSLDHALDAYLSGDTPVANVEFDRARREIARSGRLDLLARAELMRCAAGVASAVFEPCTAFEKLRMDAAAPERAYADYLIARIQAQDASLLPPPHRTLAAGALDGDAAIGALQAIEDPLSRLVALGVLFQAGRASPQAIALGVDTASDQGWRRPLLAWLKVRLALLEKSGDDGEARRVRRRIEVVAPSRMR